MNIPTPHLTPIHAPNTLLPEIPTPIILRQKRAILLLPRLVLHIRRIQILRERRQVPVFDIIIPPRERRVIQAPQRAKLTKRRQRAIDKVLMRASPPIANKPVEIAFFGGKSDINPIGAGIRNRR